MATEFILFSTLPFDVNHMWDDVKKERHVLFVITQKEKTKLFASADGYGDVVWWISAKKKVLIKKLN